MPTVLKSGSLKLLEASGRVQGCSGIALLAALRTYYLSLAEVVRMLETTRKRKDKNKNFVYFQNLDFETCNSSLFELLHT